MPIVTERGFEAVDAPAAQLLPLAAIEAGGADAPYAVELPNDADVRSLIPYLGRTELIAIEFPDFADGRGFSMARRLRALGYEGRLRARGHLIADQFPLARNCGFDEVEIDDAVAARQPEPQWLAALVMGGQALRARP